MSTTCGDCGYDEFSIYNSTHGLLCCSDCGQIKQIGKGAGVEIVKDEEGVIIDGQFIPDERSSPL